jgi:hypothetical protein
MLRRSFIPLCFAALLQAQVQTPQMGTARCLDGSARPVYGVPASFVIGKPVMQSVDAASFSSGGGMVSAQGQIQLFDPKGSLISEFEADDPAALVNIDDKASTAIAWLPASQSIVHWDGTLFLRTNAPDQIHGKVTSIRRDGDNARLLVLDSEAVMDVTVSLASGDAVSMLPLAGIQTAAFQQDSFIVFHDNDGLEVEGTDGTRRTVALQSTDLSIERMAPDWLHLMSSAARQHWALHVTATSLDLFELPAAPAGSAK